MEALQYPLTVYYDRSCNLCRDEMHYLAARGGPDKIHLVDASAPDFNNDTGVPLDELMNRIYGRTGDGTLLSGMALLRKVYVAADLGWVLHATGLPGLAPLFDRLYVIVANNRYRLPAWMSRRFFTHGACHNNSCKL
ncbi:MAG TPA: DUF393 domain-containing protein [Rhodocyclaceae bacterium]|nr:DUF393 domain-containing protein [Rhodocyclaceae bacterium]